LKEIVLLNIHTQGVPLIQEMIDNPQNIYIVSVTRREYVDYPFNNVIQYIEKLLPCTRPVTYYPSQLNVRNTIICVASYPNFLQFNVSGKVFGESSSPKGNLLYCDFFMNLYGDMKRVNSGDNGEALFMFYGVPPQPLTSVGGNDYGAIIPSESPAFRNKSYQIINYQVGNLFKLSLDDGAWQYKKLEDTSVTRFEPASMLSNNNLNCGTGMIAYTPAINPQLVDLTNYNMQIVFHHINNEQQIRIGTLQETEETAQLMNVIKVRPRQYETEDQQITATHTIDFRFTNGVCHVYFDGSDTGLSRDYSNITDMLYVGGYNSTRNSETKGLHIEEISVE
jgi:hypothetical protein